MNLRFTFDTRFITSLLCNVMPLLAIFLTTFLFFLFFCSLDGTLRIPETNLVFAISATGLEAEETYSFIKDTIKSIIENYGTERLEFSVIVYGDYASPQVRFGDIFDSDAELVEAVGSMPRISGTPSLEKALEAADDQFKSPYIRFNAAKVRWLPVKLTKLLI